MHEEICHPIRAYLDVTAAIAWPGWKPHLKHLADHSRGVWDARGSSFGGYKGFWSSSWRALCNRRCGLQLWQHRGVHGGLQIHGYDLPQGLLWAATHTRRGQGYQDHQHQRDSSAWRWPASPCIPTASVCLSTVHDGRPLCSPPPVLKQRQGPHAPASGWWAGSSGWRAELRCNTVSLCSSPVVSPCHPWRVRWQLVKQQLERETIHVRIWYG